MSTGKILQERFSWDLSDRSHSKLCLHLTITEKICFFALFLAFLGKFLMIFKKVSSHRFSIFARTIPGLECFQGLYQVTYHCFRVGEKQCCGKKKNKLGEKNKFEKSDFLGFTPKLLSILDFGVQHWSNAKIQPMTQSWNFSKWFIELFVNFSSIFGYLSNFLDHWYNFTSASNLVGCCRMQMWKCTANFRFFCVWYQRYDI